LGLVCSLGLFSGCATSSPPFEEYSLARAAIEAARIVDAPKYSVAYWSKAEEAYLRGQSNYKERDFENARREFVRARQNAEKAENTARYYKIKNGEVL
jgi:hypothetical protein